MKLASQILTNAMELLSDPIRWTQGCLARDSQGQGLSDSLSPRAVSFCVVGAIYRSAYRAGAHGATGYDMAILAMKRAINSEGIGYWNDKGQRRHSEVMEMFRNAIKIAEAEERA